jgi:hypothetical protein
MEREDERGVAKRPDRAFAKSQTHPPTSRLFFLVFFRFWAFLGKGSSKTPQKYVHKKSMSKTFPKKSTKNLLPVFPRIFNRVFGCFSAMGVQKHYKNVLQKDCVEKF